MGTRESPPAERVATGCPLEVGPEAKALSEVTGAGGRRLFTVYLWGKPLAPSVAEGNRLPARRAYSSEKSLGTKEKAFASERPRSIPYPRFGGTYPGPPPPVDGLVTINGAAPPFFQLPPRGSPP